MKDLFEFYEEQPKELREICDRWSEKIMNGLSYEDCRNFLKEVEEIGYTFDYYLDAVPYGLVKASEKRTFIYLAKLGIVISTDEEGKSDIQRIDDPQAFRDDYDLFLDFTPPRLESDQEAKSLYNSILHSTWMRLEEGE